MTSWQVNVWIWGVAGCFEKRVEVGKTVVGGRGGRLVFSSPVGSPSESLDD